MEPQTSTAAAKAARTDAQIAARPVSIPATIWELTRDELARANGNTAIARAAIKDRLLTEEGTLDAMLDSVVQAAASMATQAIVTYNRQAIVAANTGMKASAAHALASIVGKSFLDFPLAGGLPLRDATRSDVERQADLYAGQAKVMNQRARWLSMIAQAVPPGSRVGDILDEARVSALFQQASAG